MAHRRFAVAAAVLTAVLATSPTTVLSRVPANRSEVQENDLLTRIRRLTFDGARAGEGYFSPDGSKMVLQSEREDGNPFFQIYLLDLTTGDSELVSTGIGKTTCPFINPANGDIEFASTHHDPSSIRYQQEELAFRASGKERRYAWDYDPEMEIYVRDAANGQRRRLTYSRGYDAEGSYSPDGERIVFASNRNAYNRELDPQEQELLQMDPSYFTDIFIMQADGSDVRQLTNVPGYDGGPFFFPDGSRIIWREFDESGLKADVWSMLPDGTDKRRLTDFGSLSWAPYVHPSRQYLFFASNKLGFTNFEIYIVDIDGTKEPVRVTHTDGFDGLPVPSPDGTVLSWTSQRHGEKGGQIFLGRWNHERALEALAAAPPRTPNSDGGAR